MQMGLAADAAQVLREQLAVGGPDAKTALTLARALLLKDSSQDEKHQAAALLQRVLKEEPANAAAHGLLGNVYIQLGDTHNATTELAAAVRLDPADRASTYGLMTIYKQAGRTQESARYWKKRRRMKMPVIGSVWSGKTPCQWLTRLMCYAFSQYAGLCCKDCELV
jgi:predicted Zn-dependent protease